MLREGVAQWDGGALPSPECRETYKGRPEDAQRTLRGRSEALRGRSEGAQRRAESLRGRSGRTSLCNSRYPPTRACGWVVGSRPDGDGMAGTAGMAGASPNRLFLFLMISPKIISLGYFCQRNTSKLSVLRPFEGRLFTL